MRRLVGSGVANINHNRTLAEAWNKHPHARSLAQLCCYEPSLPDRLLAIPSMEVRELQAGSVEVGGWVEDS